MVVVTDDTLGPAGRELMILRRMVLMGRWMGAQNIGMREEEEETHLKREQDDDERLRDTRL